MLDETDGRRQSTVGEHVVGIETRILDRDLEAEARDLFTCRWLRAPAMNQRTCERCFRHPATACFSRVTIEGDLSLRTMRDCWRKRHRDETRIQIRPDKRTRHPEKEPAVSRGPDEQCNS